MNTDRIHRVVSPLLKPHFIAAAGVMLTVLINFPGSLSNDSVMQLGEARWHRYTDWHPPLMAFVWHYLDLIIKGPFLMLLIQAAFWWYGLYLLVCARRSTPLAALLLLIAGVWPTNLASVGTIYKDIQMSGSLIMAVGLALRFCRDYKQRPLIWISYLLLFYAAGVRHNAPAAVLPLLLWILKVHSAALRIDGIGRAARYARLSAVALIVCIGPMVVNKVLVDEENRTYVEQSLFLYDLTAISCHTGDPVLPRIALSDGIEVEDLCTSYNPVTIDPLINYRPKPLKQIRTAAYVKELRDAWISAIGKHPQSYVFHRLKIFRHQIALTNNPPYIMPMAGVSRNPFGVYWFPSVTAQAYWDITLWLQENMTFLFRPWIYLIVLLWGIVAGCGALVLRGTSLYGWLILSIGASAFLYLFSFIPFAVSADFRYALWSIMCTFMIMLVLPDAIRTRGELGFGDPIRVDFGVAGGISDAQSGASHDELLNNEGNRMDAIIEMDHVWRKFRIWKRRPTTLKEFLISTFHRDRIDYDEFWGLRDVSLQIKPGEVLGICGSNGSGKSTLLRVMARVLPATYGVIRVRGRIVTLLELATGFHPEMTGRENITLNAALIGLSMKELEKNVDSIIEFADIGRFIDSPVKVYSSGMLMRLGFSVMTHVKADILVIDEILAVGDLEYQQKCLAWMRDLRAGGTTIVVVSHDLSMLEKLSSRVMWLHRGRVAEVGEPADILGKYRNFMMHGDHAH